MDYLDVRALSRFVTIAEHQSFRSAAKALYVSQPTLSKQMQRLEADLSVKLFDRGRWGLRLTPQGEMLLIKAKRLLDDAASLQRISEASNEVIRVGAAANATGSFLAEFLGQWMAQNRDAEVRLIEDGVVGLRQKLLDREADIALLAAPIDSVFERREILEVAIQAILPRDHRLATSTEPLHVSELVGEPLLLKGEPFVATEMFKSACRLAGIQPRVVCESAVGQTLAALAETNLGIAIMADSVDLRQFDLPRRMLCTDDGLPLHFTLFAAWHRGYYVPPKLQSFIDGLAAYFQPDTGRARNSSTG